MGKKGPLWWRESDWLLRGSSAANQILLRHSGPILSESHYKLPAISNVDVNAGNCETNLNSEISDRVQNVVKVVQ